MFIKGILYIDNEVTFLFSEIFRPPIRVTNCGHSFCERCIVPRYTEPGWLCPLCKHMQNNAAEGLARNFSLEPIAASFRAQPPPKPVGEFGRCNQQLHQQDITLCKHTSNRKKTSFTLFHQDCLKHSQDLCFQCAYEKICGGIKRSDCETDTKATLKHLIERETKLVKGRVVIIIFKRLFYSNYFEMISNFNSF